jgi:hypothetical protein
MLVCGSSKSISGRGVTANMLDLGSSDSGFESQRPDKKPPKGGFVVALGFEADPSAIGPSEGGRLRRRTSLF